MTARQDGVLSADKDGSDAAPTAAKRRLDSATAPRRSPLPPDARSSPHRRTAAAVVINAGQEARCSSRACVPVSIWTRRLTVDGRCSQPNTTLTAAAPRRRPPPPELARPTIPPPIPDLACSAALPLRHHRAVELEGSGAGDGGRWAAASICCRRSEAAWGPTCLREDTRRKRPRGDAACGGVSIEE